MSDYSHIPVLLDEVLQYLDPKPGQNFVDATLGGGGYTRAILDRVAPNGKVLSIDLDTDAIEHFKHHAPSTTLQGSILAHGNFSHIDKIVVNHKFTNIQGIVADIGLSSYQLDQSTRGISFQKNEPLDMRFDQATTQDDAKFLINNKDVRELTEIFRDYGEEKFSYKIAQNIIKARAQKHITHTEELYDIIKLSLPKPVQHKAADSARRIFQALRIAVNHELENLENFLPKAFDILNPGGTLVIVSFHSLEDRIVKQYFAGLTKGCICPPDFPICQCGKDPQGKLLHKKIITATTAELQKNPRSRPAKLRAIQKL